MLECKRLARSVAMVVLLVGANVSRVHADWISELIAVANGSARIVASPTERMFQRRCVEYAVYGGTSRQGAMLSAAKQLVSPEPCAREEYLRQGASRAVTDIYEAQVQIVNVPPGAVVSLREQLAEAKRRLMTYSQVSSWAHMEACLWFEGAGEIGCDALIDIARRGRCKQAAIMILGTIASPDHAKVRNALSDLSQHGASQNVRHVAHLALKAQRLQGPATTVVHHEATLRDERQQGIATLVDGTPVTVLSPSNINTDCAWRYYRVRVVETGVEGLIPAPQLLSHAACRYQE